MIFQTLSEDFPDVSGKLATDDSQARRIGDRAASIEAVDELHNKTVIADELRPSATNARRPQMPEHRRRRKNAAGRIYKGQIMTTTNKKALITIPSPSLPSKAKGQAVTVPTIITNEGAKTTKRFLEFFTANIRNPNTRTSYVRAIHQFLTWCDDRGVTLEKIEPMVVAAYIEQLTSERSAQTVKQHLAAIRMLFDWMVIGQTLPFNPAASVRGPKYSYKKGKTPVLPVDEMRQFLERIDTSSLLGLRDRALIGLMVYSFARVSAAVGMKVKDYYANGKRHFFGLHEKGGK